MNRRHLLATIPALVVAACARQTPDQFKTYVQAISAGLSGVLTDIRAIPGVSLSPTVAASIQSELDIISSNAAAIAQAATPNADTVAAIGSAVSALVPLVSPFYPSAPLIAAALQAALALVPVILAMTGRPTASAAPAMTPEAALLILQGNARRYGR